MPLPLGKPLKREVSIDGVPHTVTVSPLGVRLVRKGFRKGHAVSWRRLLALVGAEPDLEPAADAHGDSAGEPVDGAADAPLDAHAD